MLGNYFPILLFIGIGAVIGITPLALGRLLGPFRPGKEKLAPYECGFDAFEDTRGRFDIRYYLIAILFILFDLEVAFLIPWATIFRELLAEESLRIFVVAEMFVFLGVLVAGLVYVWKKGALDWE